MANERSEVFLRDIFAQLEVAAIAGLSDGNLLRRFVGKDKQLADPAFTALVGRHGAMVLRACRSVLRDEHAAEDAFQATFLILARRAESLWVQGSLAPWLHRVAARVANRARAISTRQGWHERRVAEQRGEGRSVPLPNDIGTVIHAEVDRLPDRYRGPVILCDLEGHTHEDAALALGCPVGTVKSRLTRARARLRSRLERRGVTPAAGGIALLIGSQTRAHFTSKIATDLPQAATRFAGRQPVGPGTISASVVKLAEGTVNSMFWNKITMQLALCFAALTTVGVFGLAAELHQPEPPPETVTPPALEKPVDKPGPGADAAGVPLPKEAIARLGSTNLKHGAGSISNMRFTPNSTTLISQSDGETYAWESRTGRLLRQFPKNLCTANSHGMSLSPDGKLLAVPGSSGMRLWDIETAKEVQSIGTQRFLWMCFSPDGKLIATQGGSQFVECNIWDATNGNNIRSWTVPAGSDFATAPLFSKDGKTLITGHADNTVRFWDVATGEERQKLELDWKSPRMLVISPDGKTVAATAYNSRSIHLIDVADAKERSKILSPDQTDAYGRKERFTEIAFTPDGKSLVAAGIGDSLIFLDPATGKEQRRLEKKFKNVFSLAISPDGKTIASAINGKTIHLTDLATGRDLVEASGHEYAIWSATFADGGKLVATVGGGKEIHVWDAATGRELRRLEGHTGDVSSVTLSADGTQLVSNGADKITRFWDPSTGKEIRRTAGHGNGWNQTRSPDGKIVVTIEANPKTKASALSLIS